MDCPEMATLAAFAESGEGTQDLQRHIKTCDACEEALAALNDEVLSLQIPLSEIWFRHHVSCPHTDVLAAFRDRRLDPESLDYVKFHIEDLECGHCQARLGEMEVSTSRESTQKALGSRARVGAATSSLLADLRKRR